jgi:hypothetical protein
MEQSAMSAIALRPTAPASLTEIAVAIRADEPRFFDLGLLMLVLVLPTAFAGFVDQRLFQGIDVWDKPLKFELALAVYLLTLAFFARFVPGSVRNTRWYRVYSTAVVIAIVLEMAWIGGAAALGTASHFNSTPVGMAIYGFMGAAAVLLTSATAVYAWHIARNLRLSLSPVLRESLVIGLALTLPLTLVTAGTMSAMGGHFIGGTPSDAGGFAFFGWSRDGGDLRVAHFFATHAMHLVPAFALASAGAFGSDRRTPVRAFAALFVAFVLFAFVQALMGRPFLEFLG